jgi:hypothetical protein
MATRRLAQDRHRETASRERRKCVHVAALVFAGEYGPGCHPLGLGGQETIGQQFHGIRGGQQHIVGIEPVPARGVDPHHLAKAIRDLAVQIGIGNGTGSEPFHFANQPPETSMCHSRMMHIR